MLFFVKEGVLHKFSEVNECSESYEGELILNCDKLVNFKKCPKCFESQTCSGDKNFEI